MLFKTFKPFSSSRPALSLANGFNWFNDNPLHALALKRVNGKKLRDPVCHDLLELLSGHRSNRFKSSALMNRAAGVLDIFHHRTTREEMIRNSHNKLTLEKHLIYQTS
jgi:hypothetical protein